MTTSPDSTEPIRILVADDHPLMREGVANALRQEPDMRVVAQEDGGRAAIEQFRQHRPDVANLDVRMRHRWRFLRVPPSQAPVDTDVPSGTVKLSIRLTANEVRRLDEGAKAAGLVRAAFLSALRWLVAGTDMSLQSVWHINGVRSSSASTSPPVLVQHRLIVPLCIGSTRIYSRMVVDIREGERRSKRGVGLASSETTNLTASSGGMAPVRSKERSCFATLAASSSLRPGSTSRISGMQRMTQSDGGNLRGRVAFMFTPSI